MKKFLSKLFPIYIWSIIIISVIYALMGVAILFIGSFTRPTNKAIILLKSISGLDLFYSGKFILTTTFIVIGSLALVVIICNKNLSNYKYRKIIITIVKYSCQIWFVIAFSLFLLNSFKENVYNLITVIIATASSMWKFVGKFSTQLITSIDRSKRQKRIVPRYPPRKLPRHRR